MKLLIFAEGRKLLRMRSLWLSLLLSLALLGLYAYQYTVNAGSGVMLEDFRRASVLSSALLLAFAVIYSVPVSVVVGGLLVGQEYTNLTQGLLVALGGRFRTLGAKVATALLATVAGTVVMLMLGVIWDAVLGGDLGGFRSGQVLAQVGVVSGIDFSMVLVAMVAVTLTRSAARGSIICVLLWAVVMLVMSGVVPRSMCLLPIFYWTDFIGRAFGNLESVHAALGVEVPNGAPVGWAAAALAVAYAATCVCVLVGVAWRREYRA